MLDVIMLALAAGGLILGYWRGFIAQIVSLAGFFIAYIVAFQFYRGFSQVLQQMFAGSVSPSFQKYEFVLKLLHADTYIWNALAFALLFFGVKLALAFVGRLLQFIAKAPGLNFVNRWSGAMLGMAEALLIIVISIHVMALLPSVGVQKLLNGSSLAPYLMHYLPSFAGKLHEL